MNRIARGLEVDPLLAGGLLGLAYSRIFRATLVERHADLGLHESVELLELRSEVGFPVIVDGRDHLRRWIERALVDLDLQHGGIDAEHGDSDSGMAGTADSNCVDEPTGRQAIHWRRRHQRARLHSNDLSVG